MYDCSYNYNSNNNNYNRYDDEIEEDTFTSYVYTMGWDTYGTDYVKISHTLQLPEELDDNDVIEVKISDKAAAIDGGFVIEYPEMKVDCSVSSLIDDKLDLIRDKLSKVLFA